MNIFEAKEQAAKLGATHYRVFYVEGEYNVFSGHRTRQPFAYHFFNSQDKEVLCYSASMRTANTFETPRMWGLDFKVNTNYSEPLYLYKDEVYPTFRKEILGKQLTKLKNA